MASEFESNERIYRMASKIASLRDELAESKAECERVRENRDDWERIADSRLGNDDELTRLRAELCRDPSDE